MANAGMELIEVRRICFGPSTNHGRWSTPSVSELSAIAVSLSTVRTPPVSDAGDDDTVEMRNASGIAGWSPEYPAVLAKLKDVPYLGTAAQLAERVMTERRSQYANLASLKEPERLKAFETLYCVEGPNGPVLYEINPKTDFIACCGNTRLSMMVDALVLSKKKGSEFPTTVPALIQSFPTEELFQQAAIRSNTDRDKVARLTFEDYVHVAMTYINKGWALNHYRDLLSQKGSNTGRAWAAASAAIYAKFPLLERLVGKKGEKIEPGSLYDDGKSRDAITMVHRMISKSALQTYLKKVKEGHPDFLKPFIEALSNNTWNEVRLTPEQVYVWFESRKGKNKASDDVAVPPGKSGVSIETLSNASSSLARQFADLVTDREANGLLELLNTNSGLFDTFEKLVKVMMKMDESVRIYFEQIIGQLVLLGEKSEEEFTNTVRFIGKSLDEDAEDDEDAAEDDEDVEDVEDVEDDE